MLVWTKRKPTEVGWYWCRDLKAGSDWREPRIVKVRDYAGDLAVGNCIILDSWTKRLGTEWAGPIKPPTARRR